MFAVLALAAGVAACGDDNNDERGHADAHGERRAGGEQPRSRSVKVAFSAPGADHGWLKAAVGQREAEAKELAAST